MTAPDPASTAHAGPTPPAAGAGQPTSSGPLSPFQQVYWYADRGAPGTFASITRAFQVEGPVDPGALAASLDALLRRHPALRTRFVDTPSGPVQEVIERVPTPLVVRDREPEPDPDDLRDLLAARFDLGQAPLLRVTLLRQAPRRQTLLLAVHHIICDGWSLRVLLGELADAYRAFLAGGQWSPEPPSASQLDVVSWQQDQMTSRLPAAREFWQKVLSPRPAPVELVPGRRPERYRHARHRFALGATELVGQATRRLRVSPFVALLAGFKAVLWSWSGQEDLAVGSLFAARLLPQFEGTVGLLANATVLRTSLAGDPSFRELAGRVRSTVLDASDHQAVPIEAAAPVAELLPGWSVWFNLLPGGLDTLELAGARTRMLPPAAGFEKAPPAWEGDNLAAAVWSTATELVGYVDYNQLLLEPDRAEALAAEFRAVTVAGLTEPDQPLSVLCRWGGG